MKKLELQDMTGNQLVQQFASLAIEQDTALLDNDIAETNRLFWRLEAIEDELKRRPGDQRSELIVLYQHSNMQVRVKAAKAMLAVAPQAAREHLQAIKDSKFQPQAGEAGRSLWNLERGVFKPN